jgi:hypothetical protein
MTEKQREEVFERIVRTVSLIQTAEYLYDLAEKEMASVGVELISNPMQSHYPKSHTQLHIYEGLDTIAEALSVIPQKEKFTDGTDKFSFFAFNGMEFFELRGEELADDEAVCTD